MNIVEELRNEADGVYGQSRQPSASICAMMHEAANKIEYLQQNVVDLQAELEELKDESIVIVDEDDNEIAVIEPELANYVREKAIEMYISEALRTLAGTTDTEEEL